MFDAMVTVRKDVLNNMIDKALNSIQTQIYAKMREVEYSYECGCKFYTRLGFFDRLFTPKPKNPNDYGSSTDVSFNTKFEEIQSEYRELREQCYKIQSVLNLREVEHVHVNVDFLKELINYIPKDGK